MSLWLIYSNLQIVNFDGRNRSGLSVLEFGGKTWLSFTTFIFIYRECLLHNNYKLILDYGIWQGILIDKSPTAWSITFQQPSSQLLELFFSEKKWSKTFIYLVRLLERKLWKEHQIRFNYLLWHPVKYICITGFMFNSSH